MPKRQAKGKHKTAKQLPFKQTFTNKLSFLPLVLGFFIFALLIGLDITTTKPAKASQTANPETQRMLASSFILASSETPTPTIDFPVSETIEKTIEATEATSAAQTVPPEQFDYCLDVPVVMYHHTQPLKLAELLGHGALTVDSVIFEEQIKYLSENGYTAISSEELINALNDRRPLPEKSIMITIDDGYDDNYTYAFMTAKKYQMIMNFMIPTGLIDKPGYMTWDHLSEMAANPYARLYNHTTSHAPLGLIDKNKIIDEITAANTDFQTRLGLNNTILTYPYGSYDDEALITARELGIKAAFTTDEGRTHCVSNLMRLPRLRVGNAPMESYGF